LAEKEDVHGVGSPKNQRVRPNGNKKGAELLALGPGVGTSVEDKVPYDKDVGNAGNRVPAPLLRRSLCAESSEKTGQDHDQISDNGHEDVGTRHARQKTEVEQQERRGDGPINVASVVDLAVDGLVRVGNMVVLGADDDLVERDAVAGSHCEVGERSRECDDGRDDVVQTLVLVLVLVGAHGGLGHYVPRGSSMTRP